MGNVIQGIKVNGVTYKYDYDYLENIPLPDTGDITSDGAYLRATANGSMSWEEIDGAVPEYDYNDDGKFLCVISCDGNTELEWESIVAVPIYDCNDRGKYLCVVDCSDDVALGWKYLIPEYSTSEEGKVLMVGESDGEAVLQFDDVLPETTSLEVGKVLKVNECNGDPVVEWDDALPSYDDTDEGKVLTVSVPLNAQYGEAELEWKEIPSGNGLPECNQSDVGRILMVGNSDQEYAAVWGVRFPQLSSLDAGKSFVIDANGSDDIFLTLGIAIPDPPAENYFLVSTSEGVAWIDAADAKYLIDSVNS